MRCRRRIATKHYHDAWRASRIVGRATDLYAHASSVVWYTRRHDRNTHALVLQVWQSSVSSSMQCVFETYSLRPDVRVSTPHDTRWTHLGAEDATCTRHSEPNCRVGLVFDSRCAMYCLEICVTPKLSDIFSTKTLECKRVVLVVRSIDSSFGRDDRFGINVKLWLMCRMIKYDISLSN